MTDDPDRPDPDALLARVEAEDARAGRGRLKIFFGANAGVGKTYAMLAAARAAHAQGTVLAIGLLETHGRGDTEAMARDLPRLPLRTVEHRGRSLQEFDLDAALEAARGHRLTLLLLDELAHSNAPGSRHPKRWQDAEELLAAGLDVWTTMNVQHLESLNDIVGGITGVRVRETVPDRVFDEADEVVVVDLPPDELLARLKAGKVYVPHQAERAADHFFRKGNLLALRELALRRTADRVDDQMQAYRRNRSVSSVWPNRESLLVCVGPGPGADKVVRSGARLAAQHDLAWHAVHVQHPAAQPTEAQRAAVLKTLSLAESLGATPATLTAPDLAVALVRHAREHNLSRVVMGGRERRWRPPWRRTLAEAIAAQGEDLDVLLVAIPATQRELPAASDAAGLKGPMGASPLPPRWRGYAAAAALCGLVALVATPLVGVFEPTNIAMLFLLAVVGVAVRYGRGPAVFAAFVGVALFDFFFVPPRFSMAVSDVEYLVTFAVMGVVALVIGTLTAGLSTQVAVALERERRVRSLYDMARDLSGVLLPEQVAEIAARFARAEFGAASAVLVPDEQRRLQALPGADAVPDLAVAQWAFERGEPAGRGTGSLPGSPMLVMPLKAPMQVRGALVLDGPDARQLGPEMRRLLETGASLVAISLERLHYVDVAQRGTVQIESERLRNTLLAAISHDLRTPLASLVGLADTLRLTRPPPTPQQDEIAQAMRASASRMQALVVNLLDMARLEAGAVTLDRQWQPLEEVIGSARTALGDTLAGRPLRIDLAPDLPLLALDSVLMERVWVNLLENAAKYAPPGTPIEIVARADGEHVTIDIDDRGPGLPPGREEAMFRMFERGQSESAMPGMGLGLAISRTIVTAHGGRLRAMQREGGGARFRIELPLGEPPSVDEPVLADAGIERP
jgi:two-component system, OmpR family, sensor histidine kinase KdpD